MCFSFEIVLHNKTSPAVLIVAHKISDISLRRQKLNSVQSLALKQGKVMNQGLFVSPTKISSEKTMNTSINVIIVFGFSVLFTLLKTLILLATLLQKFDSTQN